MNVNRTDRNPVKKGLFKLSCPHISSFKGIDIMDREPCKTVENGHTFDFPHANVIGISAKPLDSSLEQIVTDEVAGFVF